MHRAPQWVKLAPFTEFAKIQMKQNTRKTIDCRKLPNDIGCTLTITGSEKEVLKVAVRHAVEEHGHQDTAELRKQLKALLKD